MRTGWRPTSFPITAVRDAVDRQNANIPGGNVTGPLREQTLRTMGRLTDAKAFNDLVDRHAQRLAHPRARHRLGRGRHQGTALDLAAQRRADRDARSRSASPAPTPSR